MTKKAIHTPVLLKEAVDGLNIKPGGIYIDATFGQGGHSREIMSRLKNKGRLIAFDQDKFAQNFALDAKNFLLIHSNFIYIPNFLELLDIDKVDGILADLGISSAHLDMPERGFSYRFDAPLDMRMNQEQQLTAQHVVNEYSLDQLTEIFKNYGELRNARQVAQAIIEARKNKKIKTTFELVNAVRHLFPARFLNKNLSKVFQAIRIEVNDELENLKKLLNIGKNYIKPGGRFAIISFHSLEDRLVKNFFKTGNFDGVLEKDIYGNFQTPFKPVNKKVITPGWQEQQKNPRARSAKLRIAEKL